MLSQSEKNDFNYKTPLKKLVQFFRDSRDKWKARSIEKQKRIDFLETKVRDLTNSRDHWKQKAKQLEKDSKHSANVSKKANSKFSRLNTKNTDNLPQIPVLSDSSNRDVVDKYYGLEDIEVLPHANGGATLIPKGFLPWETAQGHKYLLFIQQIGIQMILEAHTSLRGAMKCFELFAKGFPIQVGRKVTIQNWLLRFGLYELQKKRPFRTDWVWLIDSTIQIGTKKCFLIAGVTKAHLSKHGVKLQYKDVQVLKMEIVCQLNGKIICQYLEELSQQIGIPQQIISDHGSDLKKGIELFCQNHRKPIYTYDITHKIAILLKEMLEPCHTWQAFLNQCSLTRQRVKQTNQAFLAPPSNQKNKSRYMNLDGLIDWAQNLLAYQARDDFSQINLTQCIDQLVLSQLRVAGYSLVATDLEKLSGNLYSDKIALSQALDQTLGKNIALPAQTIILKHADLGKRKFTENFGWINDFENVIYDYSQLMQVVKLANKEVKKQGLNRQSYQKFEKQIETSQITSEMATILAQDITNFLQSEGESFPEKPIIFKSQIGLGTSDIVESIFGKFKVFIKGFAEIGKLVLTIPAFLGNITPENIKAALESVHQQDIEDWIEESIGQSTLSKRRQAFPKKGNKSRVKNNQQN